jgi:hypothetical protein
MNVTNSFTTASVTNTGGFHTLGGFIGILGPGSTILNSYSAGPVISSSGNVGGFAGINNGTLNNIFWDTNSSDWTNVAGIPAGTEIAVTPGCFTGVCQGGGGTANLSQQSTFSGWDFAGTWGILPGQSYPYLTSIYSSTPRAISGYVPGGGEGSTGLFNTNVQVAVNGNNIANLVSGEDGFYYFLVGNNVISDQSAIIVYGSGLSANSVTLAPNGGGSITDLNLTSGAVTVGGANVSSMTNSDLINAINGSVISNPDILYSFSTTPTTSVAINSGINFQTIATTSYDINNGISVSGGGQFLLNGSISINGSVSGGTIAVANGQTITVGTSGNVSQITGGVSNTYNISGTVGTINAGTGTNVFNIGDGAVITNLNGNNSVTNTLIISSSGTNTWNINGTSGSVSGGVTISGFSNFNNIQAGSGNDTFQLSSNSPLTNINGGGGNNTLVAVPGDSVFNITGGNSGSVPNITAFNNIQNLVGSTSGTNTFVFSGSGSLAGSINGGNTDHINIIDVSGSSGIVNLALGAKDARNQFNTGSLTLAGNRSSVASFTQIQQLIGNGGNLTIPTNISNFYDVLASIVLNSNGLSYIGDPFYFQGLTPTQLNSIPTTENVANIVSSPQFAQNPDVLDPTVEEATSESVTQNIDDVIQDQMTIDSPTYVVSTACGS